MLNTSVKQPLGLSPNALLFGNAFSTDPSLLTQLDRDVSNEQPRSIQDFVDTSIERQAKIIDACLKRLYIRQIYENDIKRILGHQNE